MTMTVEELRQAVGGGEIDTVVVAFTDLYGRLLGKRCDADFFLDTVLDGGTHACDYLLTVDMEMEPVDGYAFASWEQGYGDVHLVPDLATLRRASWTDGAALVLCDVESGDGPVAVAPRTILHRQLARLRERNLTAFVASELEFFVFEESYREAHAAAHGGLRSAGWYIEDYHLLPGSRLEPYLRAVRRALRDAGIPVEGTKGEWGRGQQELNVVYAEASVSADRHTVVKHAMKEIADAMGMSVTFMAKPVTEEAGSSCHLHLSMRDLAGGRTVFESDGAPTELFRSFLAGWMRYVPDFMVCYAPTVNSYKRYADASWAPTRVAWSTDNRTAGFRIVGSGEDRRIECRIPGADCNPYLAYAASIASGLAGLDERLEPPPEFRGDVYRATDLALVPATLERAVRSFVGSATARSALGDDVVDHYGRFHTVEVEAFQRTVTDWERGRYFERI